MGREDVKRSGRKGKAPPVPSLKLATAPSEGGSTTEIGNGQARVSRHRNKDGNFRQKRGQKSGNGGVPESSTGARTSRGLSSSQGSEAKPPVQYGMISGGSYKDVLLTPRYNPGQFRGMMTSRFSQFSSTQGVKSPMTARVSVQAEHTPEPPRRSKVDVKGEAAPSAHARGSMDGTPGSIVAELADQIKQLEVNMESGEPQKLQVMLHMSKAIQIAAEYIGIPAGILEMLRLHENQRIRPKLENQAIVAPVVSRKAKMPGTPEQKGTPLSTEETVSRIKSIRLKIASIEKGLFPDE